MKDCHLSQDFLDYLTYEKHFSGHTAKCYGADLVQFGGWLSANMAKPQTNTDSDNHANPWSSEHGSTATVVSTETTVDLKQVVLAVDVDTIRRYMAFLNEQQYSKSTTARKLATLRSFYKFLVKRNRLKSNPVAVIRTPKQDKKLPKFLEYEEVKRLLETPPV
ncbi:MAG: site-specific integrase, partial [Anaerohalosphaera sp.]|nr:site-specific integrase [Anaerohalosphaera sp.]